MKLCSKKSDVILVKKCETFAEEVKDTHAWTYEGNPKQGKKEHDQDDDADYCANAELTSRVCYAGLIAIWTRDFDRSRPQIKPRRVVLRDSSGRCCYCRHCTCYGRRIRIDKFCDSHLPPVTVRRRNGFCHFACWDRNVSCASTGRGPNYWNRTNIVFHIIKRRCGGERFIILHRRRHD